MQYRPLGATGIEVSIVGFGCNRIGSRSPGGADVESTIVRAVDSGITLFDTANSYTRGNSEQLLGRALRGRRTRVVLCTKAGHAYWGSLPLQRWLGPVRRHSRWNFLPRVLEMAVEGSLRRLGTDYLDVFYLHNPPASVVDDDAVFQRLDRLKERGWIREYGVACAKHATAADVLAAVNRGGVSVVQVLSNVHSFAVSEAIGPTARKRGVGLIGRQPFASGELLKDPHLQPVLRAPAGRTPAQTALRFALDLEGCASVLVGMRTADHLTENLAAVGSPSLSAAEVEALRAAARMPTCGGD